MAENLKMAEVNKWDAPALHSKVSDFKKELFNLKMQKVTSGVEKPHLYKVLKKNIARCLTAVNSKK